MTAFEKMVIKTRSQNNKQLSPKEKVSREKEVLKILGFYPNPLTINDIMKEEGITYSYSSLKIMLKRMLKNGKIKMEWQTMNTKYYNKFDERNRQKKMVWSLPND